MDFDVTQVGGFEIESKNVNQKPNFKILILHVICTWLGKYSFKLC